MSIVVIDPGLQTRVVAAGRLRSRSLGVPVGGAMDRATFALANALVGNREESAGLEIAVRGPTLRATEDVSVVVLGAPFLVEVDGRRIPPGQSIVARASQLIEIRGASSGMRAYLAVAGGFETREVLGSRDGISPLRAGDVLPCRSLVTPLRRLGPDCPFLTIPEIWNLRVVPGAQRDWFGDQDLTRLTLTVGSAIDRMGLRLDGDRFQMPDRELVSEPVCPGAIQVTREGQPIILGVDGQTIGGYPKIAHVIDADLDCLAQMRPGDRVRFEWVTFDRAEEHWRERHALLNEWRTRIEISLAGP